MGLLNSGGKIRHEDAIEKAHHEYSTYRANLTDDLTDVEKAYLDTLRDMQKKLKGNNQ